MHTAPYGAAPTVRSCNASYSYRIPELSSHVHARVPDIYYTHSSMLRCHSERIFEDTISKANVYIWIASWQRKESWEFELCNLEECNLLSLICPCSSVSDCGQSDYVWHSPGGYSSMVLSNRSLASHSSSVSVASLPLGLSLSALNLASRCSSVVFDFAWVGTYHS